jgi:hypothetical protein
LLCLRQEALRVEISIEFSIENSIAEELEDVPGKSTFAERKQSYQIGARGSSWQRTVPLY